MSGKAAGDDSAFPLSSRLGRLRLEGRVDGSSVATADRHLRALAAQRGDALDLTHGDADRFPPPDWALSRFVAAAQGKATHYTPYRGSGAVRESLAGPLSAFLHRPVDPDRELILTPGSQGALFTALSVLVEPGSPVVLPDPEYISSERILQYLDAHVLKAPLLTEGDRLTLDVERIESGFNEGARLLLFSHPNNPTGGVYEAGVIEQVASLAREHDAYVVVDQLYARLVYDDNPFVHLGSLDGMADRTVTLMGPSKTESMSGYRVGVAIGPPDVIDAMEDLVAVSVLRAPAYSQHTLSAWLSGDVDLISQRVAEYQALRDTTLKRLGDCELLDVPRPLGTAYVLPQLRAEGVSDLRIAEALITDAGLVVSPGYQFGTARPRSFRLCFAQDEVVWDSVLDRIVETLERLM